MRKLICILLITLPVITTCKAQEIDSLQLMIDEIEKSLKYDSGIIELEEGNARLIVPSGFHFLDKEQSNYVLSELWGNPEDPTIMGLLVPKYKGVMGSDSWVFTVSYDEMGFVKDDDAEKIDYNELLTDQRKEFKEINPTRIEQGYPPIEMIGWASVPYYDKEKKVLHWAKELSFGEEDGHTLNYNLRILGRKGIFLLNAVAGIDALPEVKENIDSVLASVQFNEGSTYADFNPEMDEVAAWTVGGLVAGKILAKAGFFAVILKFWKVIAIALAAGGGAFWKYISGRRREKETRFPDDPNTTSTT